MAQHPALSRLRYLVVEGPIGVGKTSLARKLATKLGAELMLEQPMENPFLARFYEDMKRFALPTQLFFLFQRAKQLEPLAQEDLFNRVTVADFLLDKDPLFARITLGGDELALYDRIYETLKPRAPRPDLVVYLQAQPDTLIERVRRRGVAFERQVSEEYLAVLAETYTRFFYHYSDAPVLIVNSENMNFVDRPEDLELLLHKMATMRSRREFFNSGG